MDVRTSSLTGAAGEHLVMSRLLSRGYIAALAPQGVLNFDIVVTSPDGAHLCAFQVKTSWEKGNDRGWHMQEKHEATVADSIFYALVDLGKNADALPAVYVVPSRQVADAVKTSYLAWRQQPGKKGQPHKNTKFRRLNLDYSKICGPDFPLKMGWLDAYRENWAQIASFAWPAHNAE
ncbi:MAG TPA: hypothetical protein PLL33_07135 [Paracoccus sp. (in: a-proteobacteria)]|nr:hypothetical protein [Paracoccus sp. (in: a-proteobacteria)]